MSASDVTSNPSELIRDGGRTEELGESVDQNVCFTPEIAGRVKRSGWEMAGLIGVLALAAVLRTWNLGQNAYCNLYFSAGVRSMMQSWHNFFYAAFDPGGFLTIDKPPVAYWIQTISSKLIGFNSYGLLLPQALAGITCVFLVYVTVRRAFGGLAGLVAALVLALTPLSVAMDRHNNADSLMVLFLVLGAWAGLRAAESRRLPWLLLSVAFAGLAFNTKMLLACVWLPALYLLYFLGAKVSWKARFGHLAAATVVLAVVSLSWFLAFDLTPPSQRPYVGSTKDNSMFSLAIGWNGMARITGEGRGFGFRGRPSGAGPGREAVSRQGRGSQADSSPFGRGDARLSLRSPGNPPGGGAPGFGPGGGGMFGIGAPGALRFATKSVATQVIWLWPLALVGGLGVATRFRLRFPLGREHQHVLFWSAWALTMAAVFSYAKGITHSYYTLQMAPPLAALAGISVGGLWVEGRRGAWRGWILPLVLLGEAAWTAYLLSDYPSWSRVLRPLVWSGVGVGVVGLALGQFAEKSKLVLGIGTTGLVIAVLAVLASPGAWSITPCLAAASPTQPSAGPGTLRGAHGPMDFDHTIENDTPLIEYLRKNRHGEKWLAATANTTDAAPLIVATGEPIMAIGGWQGAEPAISQEDLQESVRKHELRYALLSSFAPSTGRTLTAR